MPAAGCGKFLYGASLDSNMPKRLVDNDASESVPHIIAHSASFLNSSRAIPGMSMSTNP